ncbi:MAG TPA: chloride channel protein, partial [Bdellovibrionota bacterium]|nr:chloride channel protein [Bdellovibrionota bacterium]
MNSGKARSYRYASLWIGAVLVGVAAVLYAKLIFVVQRTYLTWFGRHPHYLAAAAPFAFVAATALVRRFAPDAKGSGIPQVLEAIEAGEKAPGKDGPWLSSLVSARTAVIKVISSVVGIAGGASIGREGPTVQIAASVFAGVGRKVRKYAPNIELPSYLTAGAAAGVAAAFNTPLAGITFAIEEVINGALGSFRQAMMVSVIISGITAQALLGNYLYFGRPAISEPNLHVTYQALLLGVSGGALGGIFAKVLAYPGMVRLPKHWLLRSFACGVVCSAIGLLTHGATAGSGYEPTEAALMAGSADGASLLFPILKLGTTALSYLSGMAGGIFSPSLSIGAGMGISIAKLLHFHDFRTCALMGMVAFFSGVVQAPITAVIIVTEMTDRHILIIPFMVSAFIG